MSPLWQGVTGEHSAGGGRIGLWQCLRVERAFICETKVHFKESGSDPSTNEVRDAGQVTKHPWTWAGFLFCKVQLLE